MEASTRVPSALLRTAGWLMAFGRWMLEKAAWYHQTLSQMMSLQQPTFWDAFLGYNKGVTEKQQACPSEQSEVCLGSGQEGHRMLVSGCWVETECMKGFPSMALTCGWRVQWGQEGSRLREAEEKGNWSRLRCRKKPTASPACSGSDVGTLPPVMLFLVILWASQRDQIVTE